MKKRVTVVAALGELVFAAAAASALLLSLAACGSHPESPSTGVVAQVPAHASPDPPPARPLFIEARDAASDAEAWTGFDAGIGADGDASVANDGGAMLGTPSDGSPPTPIPGADRVIAGLRPRFRNCYKLGTATDPKMQGRALLAASVSAKGDVVAVTPAQVDGMNPRVVTCLVGVLKKATFPAPRGSGSSLEVPVAFR